ncbi:hypothetical protein [Micromonospora sp. WMMB482]|uniref:hypothetical protein n=1 Tax=Micromonospora sp. WMMB482 TaxID=2849653 RepID=UPI0020B19304|nr:hypothetical protein [Micromonospora sp. WMMB482]
MLPALRVLPTRAPPPRPRRPTPQSLRPQAQLYEDLLDAGSDQGAFTLALPAAEAARNLVALEDAYGYHIIARTSVTSEQARAYLLRYASHTTDRIDLTSVTAAKYDSPATGTVT